MISYNNTVKQYGDDLTHFHLFASGAQFFEGTGHSICLSVWHDSERGFHLGSLSVIDTSHERVFEAKAEDFRFSGVATTGDLWADLNALWNACADERCLQLAVKSLF